jgi:hypothetical protein
MIFFFLYSDQKIHQKGLKNLEDKRKTEMQTKSEMDNKARYGQQRQRWIVKSEMNNKDRDGQEIQSWTTMTEMNNQDRYGQQRQRRTTKNEKHRRMWPTKTEKDNKD